MSKFQHNPNVVSAHQRNTTPALGEFRPELPVHLLPYNPAVNRELIMNHPIAHVEKRHSYYIYCTRGGIRFISYTPPEKIQWHPYP